MSIGSSDSRLGYKASGFLFLIPLLVYSSLASAGTVSFSPSRSAYNVGQTITESGSGFTPNGTYLMEFVKDGKNVGGPSGSVLANGTWTKTWTFPSTDAGSWSFRTKDNATGTWSNSISYKVGSLTVTSPNGGESWQMGTSKTVTWLQSAVTGNIQIDLYKGGTAPSNAVYQVTSGTTNDGSHTFTLPSNLTAGSNFKIGISGLNGDIFDFSNGYFTVTSSVNPVIAFAPSRGIYNVGEAITESGTGYTSGGGYTFEIKKNGEIINQSKGNANSTGAWAKYFTFPESSEGSYTFRVRDDSSGAWSNTISYKVGSLRVASPNGGESWSAGSSKSMNWSSAGLTGSVQIDLYKGGTAKSNFAVQLAASTTNDGTETFTLPTTLAAGSDYKVGMSAMNGDIYDFSNGYFTITSSANPVISFAPSKPVYEAGELVLESGTGFTPNGKYLLELFKNGEDQGGPMGDVLGNGTWTKQWTFDSEQAGSWTFRAKDVATGLWSNKFTYVVRATAPTAVVTPTSTPKGGVLNLSWSGFGGLVHLKLLRGESVATYIDTRRPASGSIEIDTGSPSFNWEVRNDYKVVVELASNDSVKAETGNIVVSAPSAQPVLTVTPRQSRYFVGDTIQENGAGFTRFGTYTFEVYKNNALVGGPSDGITFSGTWSRSYQFLDGDVGNFKLRVKDNTSRQYTPWFEYQVLNPQPTITIEPVRDTYYIGESITERGTGFTPGGRCDLTFRRLGLVVATRTIYADAKGNWSLPYRFEGAPGSFTMEALDADSSKSSAALPYTVASPLSVGIRFVKDGNGYIGACADGATELWLTTTGLPGGLTSDKVVFSLSGTLADKGALVGGVEIVSGEARQRYRVPSTLGTGNEQVYAIGISVSLNGLASSAVALSLARPPVVLMHGLNSTAASWSVGASYLRTHGFRFIENYDYQSSNDRSLLFNKNEAANAKNRAILAARSAGFACAKVDFVGHSMGGLVERVYLSGLSDFPFLNDVRKSISVGSPHSGSPLADVLLLLDEGLLNGKPVALKYLRDWAREIFGQHALGSTGAIQDLSLESDYLDNVLNVRNTEGVYCHSVVGNSSTANLPTMTSGTLQHLAWVLVEPADLELLFTDLFDGPSDLIVGATSQRGGLSGQALSQIDVDSHLSETGDLDVLQRVEALLKQDESQSTFDINGFNPPDLSFSFAGLKQLSISDKAADIIETTFVELSPNALVQAGSTLRLVVDAPTNTVSVSYLSPFAVIDSSEAPYVVDVMVPADAIGQMEIIALISGADGPLAAAKTTIDVVSSATLVSLEVVNGGELFLIPGEERQLALAGHYTDGTTRDLSGDDQGVAYSVEDSAVGSVDSAGKVQALTAGETIVLASKEGVEVGINLKVELAEEEGEGSSEGLPDGEGQAEGEGATEGIAEGSIDGEGSIEGTLEGSIEGEGASEGEGAPEGLNEGSIEGEGQVEGDVEGEGATEGATEGTPDGEGASEGEGEVQETAEVSGLITDGRSQQPILAAHVLAYSSEWGQLVSQAASLADGSYALSLPTGEGAYRLEINAVGYELVELAAVTPPSVADITLEPVAPVMPGPLDARPGAEGILLRWEPSTSYDVAGYRILRSESPDGLFVSLTGDGLIAATFFTDETVLSGTTYYYFAVAVDENAFVSEATPIVNAKAGEILVLPPQVTGQAGDAVRITWSVANADGVSPFGMDFNFYYPEEYFDLVLDNGGDVESGVSVEPTLLTLDLAFVPNLTEPGRIRLTGFAPQGLPPLVGEGHLFDVLLQLRADAASGACGPLVFLDDGPRDGVQLYNSIPTKLTVNYSASGGICVEEGCAQGDLNADGVVDNLDVQLALEVAVGLGTINPACGPGIADLNGDGLTDSADALLISRLAAGLPLNPTSSKNTLARFRGSKGVDAPVQFSLGHTAAEQGSVATLSLVLQGDIPLTGGEVSVAYPPELEFLGAHFSGADSNSLAVNTTPGFVQLALGQSAAQDKSIEDATVLSLSFVVSPQAKPGAVLPLTLAKIYIKGEFGERAEWYLDQEAFNGSVTVLEAAATTGNGEPRVQSADQDGDLAISLTELLRVIQFYNMSGIHCAEAPLETEDGYVPGTGDNKSCAPYDTDANPQDWVINLSELLRMIQFFNTQGYSYCPFAETEDGFCPGQT